MTEAESLWFWPLKDSWKEGRGKIQIEGHDKFQIKK